MATPYGISSLEYLLRARQRLNEATHHSLFYAAFELRAGTEARLQQYLEAREDIAEHKKQGWKIIGSAKELDRGLHLGDKICEARFFDANGDVKMAAYYTPITARLRDTAGALLHDLLHAMKLLRTDDDNWWSETRSFLEQIYSDLEFATKGTLLGPLMRGPDNKSIHAILSIHQDAPLANTLANFSKVGAGYTVAVRYLDSLPDHASPFLNPTIL
jgi:hypothetical protein